MQAYVNINIKPKEKKMKWGEHRLVVGVLVEASSAGEDEERDFSVSEHGEFVGLLEQPVHSLAEGHLSIRCVLDPLYLYLPSPHLFFLNQRLSAEYVLSIVALAIIRYYVYPC